MTSSYPASVFYLIMLAAMLLVRIPGIGKILRTFNTLLHESGHMLMAILLNGTVHEVRLNSDLSGSASTSSNSRLKSTLISLNGYPFAALSILALFALLRNGYYQAGYIALISLALIHLTFFVRNTFGMIWLALFIVLLTVSFTQAPPQVAEWVLTGLILIALAEAIISTIQIILLGLTKPRKAGDITNLARTTRLPAWLWALIMLALCAWIIYHIIAGYFPSPSQLLTEFGVNINS
ncbi:MAG: M50 family metallopeptidase [Lentimicrobium sp.]|jgi:hypothetical protein|nr:M50 family metallopeptidase [Lentimicrobium sp.]